MTNKTLAVDAGDVMELINIATNNLLNELVDAIDMERPEIAAFILPTILGTIHLGLGDEGLDKAITASLMLVNGMNKSPSQSIH